MRFFKHCCVVFLVLFCIPTAIILAQDTIQSDPDNDQTTQDPRLQRDNIYKKRLQYFDNQIDAGNAELSTIREAAQLASMMAKYDKATQYYRKAIRIMRDNGSIPVEDIRTVYKQLIYLYQRDQKMEMATATFKQMCNNEPDNIDLRFEFAQFLQKIGFPLRALLEYKTILSQEPDNLLVIDKIMQLHAQGYITQDELESIIPQTQTH